MIPPPTEPIDAPAPTGRRLIAYGLLATVVLVLGFNWPLLATGLRTLSPLWMSSLRLLGGLVVMLAIAGASGNLRGPHRTDLPVMWSVGIFRLALVFLMVFIALQIVPPGRSSVLVWTASLWTVPLAAIFLKERLNALRWAGLAVGVVGIVVLFEPWALDWDDPRVVVGHVLLLTAAFTNAATSVHIRRHGWATTPLELMPWQLLVAAIPMTVLALVIDGPLHVQWTPQLIGIVVYQGALATSVALWAQQTVLRRLPATSTNLTLMAVPVVGLISSALLVGEDITLTVIAGVALILLGVGSNVLSETWI